MKIVVINFSGNVGKSTLSDNLLRPRIPDAQVFKVESINADLSDDGRNSIILRGKKYGEIVEQVMMSENVIVDVGASNAEDFFKQMQQYAGSHEEFDFFLVPTVKEKKQQADTITTLRALHAIGIPRKKIRLVFNKMDKDETPEEVFSAIFGLASLEKSFTLNPDAVIYENEVFERLKGLTLDDLNADTVDYRALLKEQKDADGKEHCIKMAMLKRLSITATANLNEVFHTLFKG